MRFNFVAAIFIALIMSSLFSCKNGNSPSSDSDTTAAELRSLNLEIEKDGSNPTLLTRRAEYYLNHEQLTNALADVQKAIKLDSLKTKPYSVLSAILMLSGKPQESLDALNQALLIDPKDTDVLLQKAKLYLVMKDYSNLANAVEAALAVNPQLADAYYYKGMALMENNELSKAESSFQQAVQIDSRHYESLMQLGYITNTHNPKMAIDYFNSALLAQPKSTEALYNLGLLYQENGQPVKAEKAYSQIAMIDPANKLAFYNMGYVEMVYLNKLKEAQSNFTKAIELDSTYIDAVYNRGLSREMLNMPDLAREDFNKVLKMRVNDGQAIDALNRLDKAGRR